jgi:hypothetical protein
VYVRFGLVAASFCTKCFSFGQKRDQRAAAGVRLLWPPCGLAQRFSLRSTRDRRIAPGVRLLRPNPGPSPPQAVFSSVNSRPTHRSRRALTSAESWPCPASSSFLFGQLETDASLQACAYFGRIVALPRFKRFSLRSTRDRRIAPGVRLLWPNHGPSPLQAVFSSVTTISDRLGVCAPKAIRAKAVTYRAEGHFGD